MMAEDIRLLLLRQKSNTEGAPTIMGFDSLDMTKKINVVPPL